MSPHIPNDELPPEGDEVENAGQPVEGGDGLGEAPPVAPPRGRRQGLIKKKRDELVPWLTAVVGRLDEPREIVIRGEGITSSRADLDKLASALGHVASMLKQAGALPMVSAEGVTLAQSAHVHLVPAPDEIRRAEQGLREAKELQGIAADQAEKGERRAARETNKTIEKLLRAAVPDIDVALALTADLIEAPVDEAPLRVAEFGQQAADTYRSLVDTLSKAGLSLELPVATIINDEPQIRTARISYGRATHVAQVLREPSETASQLIHVRGVLSLADARKKLFRLDLDVGVPRPEAVKGKRSILGMYSPSIEDSILWNTHVLASIEIVRDIVFSTPRTRPPKYELVAVTAIDDLST